MQTTIRTYVDDAGVIVDVVNINIHYSNVN